jgi:hypothetical protein
MSISNFTEDKLLAAVFNNVSYVVAGTFIKLHIGDPGENCTSNAAAHTTRVSSAWTAASGGTLSNSGAVSFTPMAATETISWISVWDNLTAGNPLWYGALVTPQAVNIGGTLNFAIGAIVVTLN